MAAASFVVVETVNLAGLGQEKILLVPGLKKTPREARFSSWPSWPDTTFATVRKPSTAHLTYNSEAHVGRQGKQPGTCQMESTACLGGPSAISMSKGLPRRTAD